MNLRDVVAKFAIFSMRKQQMDDAICEYSRILDKTTDIDDMVAALDFDLDRLELPADLALKTCDKLLSLAKDNKRAVWLCARFISLYDEGRRDEVDELYQRAEILTR